ncbi:DUF5789 family protein [Halapricum hydrolyticum]|uniref:Uncharacterized protein n=1 Tax=Halapricum hydrolyticum TaxID=2979991 RepID=A0AAE3IDP1_9EURY|nr:hypothetical protein [Halapricum hydrolyticum]MCU4717530.1 hypothetical protein [Halapricum hydrolyticum]MCU4726694.1 hypothetical protein [Halapricum hydrolyticum]
MADDKSGREKQARDADRRQREREIAMELERGDEPEPPIEPAVLADLESELESVSFPATGSDVIAAVGNREIESVDGPYTVEELVADTDAERFDTPESVRVRVQRPTIATAMKRVVEAAGTLRNEEFGDSQRTAYEKTFRELKAIDADDEDEGIRAVADWIVGRIHEQGKLPGSRAVRRQAAEFCRENGYEIRNDEWLGI